MVDEESLYESPLAESEEPVDSSPEAASKMRYFKEATQRAYEEWYKKISMNQLKEDERIVICESSLDDYCEFRAFLPKTAYFDSGLVILKGMPSGRHSYPSIAILFYLNMLFHGALRCSGDLDLSFSPGTMKSPDGSFIPVGRRSLILSKDRKNRRRQYPTVVFETAYMNESIDTLKKEMLAWIGPYTAVEIAFGIKIIQYQDLYSLLFVMAFKGNSHCLEYEIGEIDSDGKVLVDRSALPSIPLSLSSIFESADIPQVFCGISNIDLDLKQLSDTLLEALKDNDRDEESER